MSRRDRTRKPARRPGTIEARRRILVLCEGERTEPEYIEGFRKWCCASLVKVKIVGPEVGPFKLVTRALDLRNEAETAAKREKDVNLRYDRVWCVFDRDEHERFDEAIKMAQDNGLDLAVSNPCIELWLLLHFRDSPGLQHRDALGDMLKKHIADYDKGVDFANYEKGYLEAHNRAAKLDEHCRNDGELFRNPSTGMYLLTAEISRYANLGARSGKSSPSISNASSPPRQNRKKSQ